VFYPCTMKVFGLIAGILLTLVGSVWVLQGLDSTFAPRSFMTGSRLWLWAGVATAIGGFILIRSSLKHR
jgi:hypothetical protein